MIYRCTQSLRGITSEILSFNTKLLNHDDVIKWKIFRVTGPLCGEFIGDRWIPSQRPVMRSFDVFFDLRLNKRLSKQRDAGDLRRHRTHYDVTITQNVYHQIRNVFFYFYGRYNKVFLEQSWSTYNLKMIVTWRQSATYSRFGPINQ